MKKIISILLLSLLLVACGGDSSKESTVNSDSKQIIKVIDSQLTKFMSKDSVCDIIIAETVQNSFNSLKVVYTESSERKSKRSNSFTCSYKWERADADIRKKKFKTYIVDQMQGKIEKIAKRQRVFDHTFSIRLQEYKADAKQFIPAKLTEEQLEKRIAQAKEMAAKRLTQTQKRLAGSAANSMMEKMLRQNNENIKVDEIGDAAYWTAVGGGSLNVLFGNIKASISPMIGETLKEDIEYAKFIAKLISNSNM